MCLIYYKVMLLIATNSFKKLVATVNISHEVPRINVVSI